jgi:hypothetical protein
MREQSGNLSVVECVGMVMEGHAQGRNCMQRTARDLNKAASRNIGTTSRKCISRTNINYQLIAGKCSGNHKSISLTYTPTFISQVQEIASLDDFEIVCILQDEVYRSVSLVIRFRGPRAL